MTRTGRLGDRIAAWRVRRARSADQLLALPPLPLTGDVDRAEALLAGRSVWDRPDGPAFGWLDDLAAIGDERAGRLAARMTGDWITTFGTGRGWTADVTGLRLLRWLAHARFLHPRGVPHEAMRAVAMQAAFLERRWQAAVGWGRIAALAGLSAAALALDRPSLRPAPPPMPPLPRHPEELTEALILMVALRDTWPGLTLPEVADAATTLRTLRHADGRLTRLVGGGGGDPHRVDAALTLSRVRGGPKPQAAGIARLVRGRSTVLLDLTAPGAFEMTAGRHPIVVVAPDLRIAGRTPRNVPAKVAMDPQTVLAGWAGAWPRLNHSRSLTLSPDGDRLTGRDDLATARRRARPADVVLRIPLHPAIVATSQGEDILLTLPGGARWRFAAQGAALDGQVITVTRPALRFPACIDWTFARADATPLPIRDLPPGASS